MSCQHSVRRRVEEIPYGFKAWFECVTCGRRFETREQAERDSAKRRVL